MQRLIYKPNIAIVWRLKNTFSLPMDYKNHDIPFREMQPFGIYNLSYICIKFDPYFI